MTRHYRHHILFSTLIIAMIACVTRLTANPDIEAINLIEAIKKKDIERVKSLLAQGADPFHTVSRFCFDHPGETPTFYAFEEDTPDDIRMLLVTHDTVNTPAANGQTIMHLAAYYGHVNVLNCLSKIGGNVNARDIMNETPLFDAVAGYRLNAIECLLGLGATINAVNFYGLTPLQCARKLQPKNAQDKFTLAKIIGILENPELLLTQKPLQAHRRRLPVAELPLPPLDPTIGELWPGSAIL